MHGSASRATNTKHSHSRKGKRLERDCASCIPKKSRARMPSRKRKRKTLTNQMLTSLSDDPRFRQAMLSLSMFTSYALILELAATSQSQTKPIRDPLDGQHLFLLRNLAGRRLRFPNTRTSATNADPRVADAKHTAQVPNLHLLRSVRKMSVCECRRV